jgi:hypothetical protein
LDDLLAVLREFLNPHVLRSGLDRCLRRHGVGNLRELKPKDAKPTHSSFKAYEPGYLHIDIKDLPQMADEDRRRYLFVAIDRATRWGDGRPGNDPGDRFSPERAEPCRSCASTRRKRRPMRAASCGIWRARPR